MQKKHLVNIFVVILVFAVFCLILQCLHIPTTKSLPYLRHHNRTSAVKWPFLADRRVLFKTWPATCPRDTHCISFGTPIFGSWKLWSEYINNWSSKFKKDALKCAFVSDPAAADTVVFHGIDIYNSSLILRQRQLLSHQTWVYFSWESPITLTSFLNGQSMGVWRYLFNWTATYQRNSDIYAPYGTLEKEPSQKGPEQFVRRRKYLAFAVVSNCLTKVKRINYLRELQKHMELHIFGKCGNPFPYKNFTDAAHDYHFYFAFENCRCKDYITEKLWMNALNTGVVPVVFGAPVRDYHDAAPPGSFIAGESFRSIKELASYLKKVAADPELYSAFFKWRKNYRLKSDDKVEVFLRKLCHKLYSNYPRQTKDLFDEWYPDKYCNFMPWI